MLVEKLSDILVSWVSFRVFTIQRSYETPRQGRTSPAGTHVMLGGLLCPRGGLGTDAAMEGLFMPTWCCRCGEHQPAVGWEWWDRTMEIGSAWYKEIESIGLGFYAKKPSPLDSVSMQRNWVLWTRFLPTFFVREQLSSYRNRVLFTRIARNQNSLKRFLTNNIVWVLLLFSKKNRTVT